MKSASFVKPSVSDKMKGSYVSKIPRVSPRKKMPDSPKPPREFSKVSYDIPVVPKSFAEVTKIMLLPALANEFDSIIPRETKKSNKSSGQRKKDMLH